MANENESQFENDGPDLGASREEGAAPAPARRAASAEFVVQGAIGSEAALREAMDPANQSLAESLRLSYRVLQVVIVILLVLFLVSGVRTVEPTQSGVMLRFGAIQADAAGAEALEPGVQFNWPFPAGELVLVDVQNRSADLGNAFWPDIRGTTTIEQAVEGSHPNIGLKPNVDGYVVVMGSDLAHLKISVKYEIRSPQLFLERINENSANQLVIWALRRATVHTAAKLSLEDITELTPEVRESIRDGAQEMLDQVNSGIRIAEVNIPDTRPPLAIVKAQRELQEAAVQSQQLIELSRQEADKALIAMAGPNYHKLLALIERYENALGEDDAPAAEALYRELESAMTGPDAAGDLAETIERARAYQSEVETTLGSEARLFTSLMKAYRDSPRLVVQRRWLDAYRTVMNASDVEVMFVPGALEKFVLNFSSNQRIAQIRHTNWLNRLDARTIKEAQQGYSPVFGAGEITIDGPGARLRTEGGKAVSTKDR